MTTSTTGPDAHIQPLLIDIRQAAKRLGISERTLWGMGKRGEMPTVSCGRRQLYDPRDLVRWVDANKTRAGRTGDLQGPQNGTEALVDMPELSLILETWDDLPQAIRQAITIIVQNAQADR